MRITENDVVDIEIAGKGVFLDRIVIELADRTQLSAGDFHRLTEATTALGFDQSIELVTLDKTETGGSDLIIFRGFGSTGESAPMQPSAVLLALLCSPTNAPLTVRRRGAIRSALARGMLADLLRSAVGQSSLADQIGTEFD